MEHGHMAIEDKPCVAQST